MAKEECNYNGANSSENSGNMHLAYEYTEKFYSILDKNIDNLNTRLGTFLGFSGLLLRLALDLPGKGAETVENLPCLTCLILKVAVCLLAAASLFVSTLGLTARNTGKIVKPEILMSDKWFFESSEDECKAMIAKTTIEGTQDSENIIERKARQLNISIWLLLASAIAFASDVMISSILCDR